MKPLYIFDLDGTLALIEHRRHFVERPSCPYCGWVKDCDHHRNGTRLIFKPDWDSFYAACVDDVPNRPVLATMERLRNSGADIWIFSGRSDEVREQTMKWLATHTSFSFEELRGPMLTMRKEGDYTADDVLKKRWLDNMLLVDRQRLIATFDDRDRVVSMWREAGVTCFQVAAGDF